MRAGLRIRRMKDVLPDHLRAGLTIVFCGTAAGTASAARRAYYAGPGNLFWPMLHETGLTERLLVPEQFALLNNYRIGLTDVAKKTSGSDNSLRKQDFCVESFTERMESTRPKLIAFNGKKAASVVLQRPTHAIGYGLQDESLGESRLFVLPSTSGSGRKYWDKTHWVELARVAREAEF
jgi:double-stranded uracil-DNA glycosylase